MASGILFHRRIAAELNFGFKLAGILSGEAKRHRLSGAQHHAALLLADPILINPGPRAALANPQSKAANVVIKLDVIPLPTRKLDSICRLHC